jgi:hypothetical protein
MLTILEVIAKKDIKPNPNMIIFFLIRKSIFQKLQT